MNTLINLTFSCILNTFFTSFFFKSFLSCHQDKTTSYQNERFVEFTKGRIIGQHTSGRSLQLGVNIPENRCKTDEVGPCSQRKAQVLIKTVLASLF